MIHRSLFDRKTEKQNQARSAKARSTNCCGPFVRVRTRIQSENNVRFGPYYDKKSWTSFKPLPDRASGRLSSIRPALRAPETLIRPSRAVGSRLASSRRCVALSHALFPSRANGLGRRRVAARGGVVARSPDRARRARSPRRRFDPRRARARRHDAVDVHAVRPSRPERVRDTERATILGEGWTRAERDPLRLRQQHVAQGAAHRVDNRDVVHAKCVVASSRPSFAARAAPPRPRLVVVVVVVVVVSDLPPAPRPPPTPVAVPLVVLNSLVIFVKVVFG